MLTITNLSDMRAELRSTLKAIEALRFMFMGSGYTVDARRMNDAAGMIAEEIDALDSAIAAEFATSQKGPSQF